MLFEITTKGIQMTGAFGHVRSPMDNRVALSFHCGKNSLALVEKRCVQKKISMCCESDMFCWRMLKPIMNDSSNGTDTVTALSGYLPSRVALDNPALEPNPFAHILVDSVLADKSATALLTQPALFVFPASSVTLNAN